MILASGDRLGPYEILGAIGAGGMGEVYRARDTRLHRAVAIKVLPASFSKDAGRLRRFEQEARAASALNHPGILTIYDFGEHEGSPYLVAELLEGESLRERLAGDRLPLRKALDYAAQIARGLAAAHEKGIVHRDLKPENLFVTKDGRVKILDFGLAKLTRSEGDGAPSAMGTTETAASRPGVAMGTAGYMSPEQVRGLPSDSRSDLFSFGAVLYEMLTGERAFRGDTEVETLTAILKEDPAEPSRTVADLPASLDRIVRHCLEKSPEERFQSARDLAFDLESLTVSGSGATAVSAPAVRRRTRLARPAIFAVAAVAVAAVFAGAYFLGRGGRRPAEPWNLRRITFRHGNVLNARFTPDGESVVYGAAWDGRPSEVFVTRRDGTQSRALGVEKADVLAVSPKGELAVLLKKSFLRAVFGTGTLAVLPLEGGIPRELVPDVREADFGPDGTLAVLRTVGGVRGRYRVEYPPERVLFESTNELSFLDVSPAGDLVAFVERSDPASIKLVERGGAVRTVPREWAGVTSMRFAQRGNRVLVLGWRSDRPAALVEIGLDGREKVLQPLTADFQIHDVGPDGRLLLEESHHDQVLTAISPGAPARNLSWLDLSGVAHLARDGQSILFNERGEGGGPNGTIFLWRLSEVEPVRLGEGRGSAISDDGAWVLARRPGSPPTLVLLPIGPGKERGLNTSGLERLSASRFLPGSLNVIVQGSEKDGPWRFYAVQEGKIPPRPVSPPIGNWSYAISHDGKAIVSSDPEARLTLYPLDGGAPRLLPGLPSPLYVVEWSADGESLLVVGWAQNPFQIFRYELATQRYEPFKELVPSDPVTALQLFNVVATSDFRTLAYSYERVVVSDLYVAQRAR
jgi:hypothetical protein